MRNPCEANVKNRKLLAKIACGRSGRSCIVSGQSYGVRATLCSRHRAKEARRYKVEIVRKTSIDQEITDLREQCLVHRFLYYVRCLPVISDGDYDLLERKLKRLVESNPGVGKYAGICPSQTVGSSFASDYPKEIQEKANEISSKPVTNGDFLEGL